MYCFLGGLKTSFFTNLVCGSFSGSIIPLWWPPLCRSSHFCCPLIWIHPFSPKQGMKTWSVSFCHIVDQLLPFSHWYIWSNTIIFVRYSNIKNNFFSCLLMEWPIWASFTFYICLLCSLHYRRSILADQKYLSMKCISSLPGLGDYKLATLSDTSSVPFWHAPPTFLYRHVHPYDRRNLVSTHLCIRNRSLKVWTHSIIIQKIIFCVVSVIYNEIIF